MRLLVGYPGLLTVQQSVGAVLDDLDLPLLIYSVTPSTLTWPINLTVRIK